MTEPTLLELTKSRVEQIAKDFTEPDDDFIPVLMVRAHNDQVAIIGLMGDMNSQSEKDDMAKFMMAACAVLRAKEVSFVSSAWAAKAIPKEEFESGDFVMPRDRPDRIEVVNIMHSTSDGDTMSTSEISREDGKPPTIGGWEVVGGEGIKLGGRFGDAIHDGMFIGSKLVDPEVTPDLMREYMDEMIEKGELEELIQSFMRGAAGAAKKIAEDKKAEDQT